MITHVHQISAWLDHFSEKSKFRAQKTSQNWGQIFEFFKSCSKAALTRYPGVIMVGDYDYRVESFEKIQSRAQNLRKRQILLFLSLVTDN